MIPRMTVRRYADLQRAYVATLEPWLAAQAEHTVARAAYEKALRAGKPPVTGDSHTARNKSIVARSLVQGRIVAAHKVWRNAEAVWKAAKAARFEALQAVWKAERELAAVKVNRRRLAALKATEPGVREVSCEPKGELWVATIKWVEQVDFDVAGTTYVDAILNLIQAAGRKDLLRIL